MLNKRHVRKHDFEKLLLLYFCELARQIKWKLISKSQKEAPTILNQAILNQTETQIKLVKGRSSYTKSNGNSNPAVLNQMETQIKSQKEAPAIPNPKECQSSNTQSNGNSNQNLPKEAPAIPNRMETPTQQYSIICKLKSKSQNKSSGHTKLIGNSNPAINWKLKSKSEK